MSYRQRDPLTYWLVVAALACALFATGWVIEPTVHGWIEDSGIDCGPDGQPALDGTACIDKEPAVTTYP